MDFGSVKVDISDGIIKVNAPMYSTEFSADEIEDVYQAEKLGNGVRTNGAAANDYRLGHFRLNEFGDCMLYVYSDEAPYTVVKLRDKSVIFNLKDRNENETLFDKLKEYDKK